jgi:hypothetical protein
MLFFCCNTALTAAQILNYSTPKTMTDDNTVLHWMWSVNTAIGVRIGFVFGIKWRNGWVRVTVGQEVYSIHWPLKWPIVPWNKQGPDVAHTASTNIRVIWRTMIVHYSFLHTLCSLLRPNELYQPTLHIQLATICASSGSFKLVKKFPDFYKTGQLIAVFTNTTAAVYP